jgi:hypothetical protein
MRSIGTVASPGLVLAAMADLFGGQDTDVVSEDVSRTLPLGQRPKLAAYVDHLLRCDPGRRMPKAAGRVS